MSYLPQISGKNLIKILEQIGYKVARQKGSHIRLKHKDATRKPVTVPNHKAIGKGLLRKILRDAKLETKILQGKR